MIDHTEYETWRVAAEEKVRQAKEEFDRLVDAREAARKRIVPEVEDSDSEYLRLEQESFEAYGRLAQARADAGQCMLD